MRAPNLYELDLMADVYELVIAIYDVNYLYVIEYTFWV